MATSEGIPSSIDIEFLELNDNPYIKVLVKSEHSIPAWHGGKGKPGFLFVDEICVK